MGIWRTDESVVTNVGNDLLAQLAVAEQPLVLTKAVAGSSLVSDVNALKALTEIASQEQQLQLGALQYTTTGKCSVEVLLDNSTINTPYTCNQIGLFAESASGETEVLFAVMQAYEPDAIPASTSPIIIKHKLIFSFGDVTEVQISASFSGIATEDFVMSQLENYEPKIATKNSAFNKSFGDDEDEMAAPAQSAYAGQSNNVSRADHVHPLPSGIRYAENDWVQATKTQLTADTDEWTLQYSGTVNSSGGYALDANLDTWNAYTYTFTSEQMTALAGKTIEWGVETFVGTTARLEIVNDGTMLTQLNSQLLSGEYTLPDTLTNLMVRAIVFGTDTQVKFTGFYMYDKNEQVDVSTGQVIYLVMRKVKKENLPDVATPGTLYLTPDGGLYLGMDDTTLLPLAGSAPLNDNS